jgi:hypothetical protein
MLKSLLNQAMTLYPKIKENEYGKPVYGTSQAIKCRFEDSSQIIRKPNGEVFQAKGRVFSLVELKSGDKLNDGEDWFVSFVKAYPDKLGRISYWEAYV